MNDYFSTLKEHLGQIVAKTCVQYNIKVPAAILVGMADYFLGRENHSPMGMLVVLITFDLITALMATYKTKDPIESRKVLKTATKTVVYGLMVSGAHLTEQIVPGTTFLDYAAINFLAITELISILENIGKMGYETPQKILNKLKKLKDDTK